MSDFFANGVVNGVVPKARAWRSINAAAFASQQYEGLKADPWFPATERLTYVRTAGPDRKPRPRAPVVLTRGPVLRAPDPRHRRACLQVQGSRAAQDLRAPPLLRVHHYLRRRLGFRRLARHPEEDLSPPGLSGRRLPGDGHGGGRNHRHVQRHPIRRHVIPERAVGERQVGTGTQDIRWQPVAQSR